MPAIKGMSLARAEKVFGDATQGSGLALRPINWAGVGEIINLTNWTICSQDPAAGATLTAKSKPAVGVKRPNEC